MKEALPLSRRTPRPTLDRSPPLNRKRRRGVVLLPVAELVRQLREAAERDDERARV